MSTATVEVESKVQELMAVLDRDIEHMQQSLGRLEELRVLVIKRDEAGLKELLEKIRVESESNAANERARQLLRAQLAQMCGHEPQQLTLSRLEAVLPDKFRLPLAERKSSLRALAGQLARENLSVGMLLADCARINNQLLRGILEHGGKGLVCYDASGAKQRQANTTFVNVRL